VKRFATVLYLLVRSALRGLQVGAVTSVVSILTIAVTVLLLGAFALLVGNMSGLLDRFGSDLEVRAYLEHGIAPDEAKLLAGRVATVEGVQNVELITPEQAFEELRESLSDDSMLDGLASNPLPTTLAITLLPEHRDREHLAILEEALTGVPGIDEIAQGQEWIDGYARATALVRVAALSLGTVLSVAALMIVANTIRLALYAREDELEILGLVGASRSYIRIPFLLEGTLQGTLGGILAAGLLYLGYSLFLPRIQYGLALFLGSAEPRFFDASELLLLISGGATLGIMGSATALVSWRWSQG